MSKEIEYLRICMILKYLVILLVLFQTLEHYTYAKSNNRSNNVDQFLYDKIFQNYAATQNKPDAVAIIAFNRPHYLAQTLASLEKNPESQSLPFFFFLDGGPKAMQQENITLINASSIKIKHIIARQKNYGCPKNHIDSKRFMFDWCGFSRVIILEEDIEVAPNYIGLMHAVDDWAHKNFSNVGIVQTWANIPRSREEKLTLLNAVVESGPSHWWCLIDYCLRKDAWDEIKHVLFEFESYINNIIPDDDEHTLERSKPGRNELITQKMRTLIKKLIYTKGNNPLARFQMNPFPESSWGFIRRRMLIQKFAPCQDAVTAFALYCAGLVKIRTVVNRAIHRGEEGISFTSEKYKAQHAGLALDIFDKDDELQDFIVVSNTDYMPIS